MKNAFTIITPTTIDSNKLSLFVYIGNKLL